MSIFILQLILLLFLSGFLVFFTVQFYNIIFRGFAPFVSTRKKIINKIIEELHIDDKATVYELGCGRAGFLRAVRTKFPHAELIGIEYSFWPYLIARIQNALTGSGLKIRKENIYNAHVSEADAIYCYLNQPMMEALEVKFKKECRRGTIIASYQFRLPNMEAFKKLEVGKHERVYFYRI